MYNTPAVYLNGNYSIGRTGVLSFVSAGIKGITHLSRKPSMLFVLPSAGAKPAAFFLRLKTPKGLEARVKNMLTYALQGK